MPRSEAIEAGLSLVGGWLASPTTRELMAAPAKFGDSNNRNGWFSTTHWSVVLAARQQSPESSAAMETLCRAYWSPLYTYLRRRGYDINYAQDLTQEFVAHLLSKDFLSGVSPEKGRFRSFLLASLNNFLVSEHERATAQKRGGGMAIVPIDADGAEEWLSVALSGGCTPEEAFDRRWALTLLEKAFARVKDEFAASRKEAQFERLKEFLEGDVSHGDYNLAARDLHMTPNAV